MNHGISTRRMNNFLLCFNVYAAVISCEDNIRRMSVFVLLLLLFFSFFFYYFHSVLFVLLMFVLALMSLIAVLAIILMLILMKINPKGIKYNSYIVNYREYCLYGDQNSQNYI